MIRPPPRSPLFPYTTLFRSLLAVRRVADRHAAGVEVRAPQVARVLGRGVGPPADRAAQASLAHCWTRRAFGGIDRGRADRKSTRLNSSHANLSYAVFCLTKT